MSGIDPAGARVVVTGAGSGIGAATAARYARLGASVVAVDIDGDTAAATAAACRREHPAGDHRAETCDVADAGAVEALAAECGEVDIVVNNAGVGVGGAFLDTTLDDWEWLRGVNLDGVLHGCRFFGRGMVDRGRGQVVNVASGAGYIATRRMATYCASKAAVVHFSRCLRADWRGTGVGVSVICPGVINTPILDAVPLRGDAGEQRDRLARGFRYGHAPEAVAKAIVDAARRDRGQVAVGVEARLAYHVLRVVPGPVHDLLARA